LRKIILCFLFALSSIGLIAQPSGDYCDKISKNVVTKITIQQNNSFEYKALNNFHAYEEIIHKGYYELNKDSIKFIVKEQFLNKDSLVAYPITEYMFTGKTLSNAILVNHNGIIKYRKDNCVVYEERLKQWAKLRSKAHGTTR
jgi:hypothetical protein